MGLGADSELTSSYSQLSQLIAAHDQWLSTRRQAADGVVTGVVTSGQRPTADGVTACTCQLQAEARLRLSGSDLVYI